MLVLQLREQLEDLGLHRHVQRRGRLVGDQQIGAEGERHCDHHSLAHPTGELVRVGVDPLLRARNADNAQELDGSRARRLLAHLLVGLDRFDHLPADAVHRVQRGQRVLEDHRHAPSPHVA